MVALYDGVMGGKQKLTFEQFKEKHQRSALFTRRLAKQAFIVRNLQRIVGRNDY